MNEKSNDPLVGSTILALDVDLVAATGYRASKLLGSTIYNDHGEKIGKLEDFIVGSDHKASVAIISVGGFLGMGARMAGVPAAAFESNAQSQTVLPGATKDVLKALPQFRYAE